MSKGRPASAKGVTPAYPGEILKNDFLEPLALSVYAFANAIKAPRSRVNDIVRGRRSGTTDTALRLARYFGTTAEYWINLQARYTGPELLKMKTRAGRAAKPCGDFAALRLAEWLNI